MNEENNLNTVPQTNPEPVTPVEPVQPVQPTTPVTSEPQVNAEAIMEQKVVEMEQEMMKEHIVPPEEHHEEVETPAPEAQVAQPAEPQIDPSFGTNVPNPVQPVPAPTKKKSKLPVVLLVLVILAAGGFACWKYLLPMLNKGDTSKETTSAQTIKEELKDQTIITKLNKAISFYETVGISRINEELYKTENFKMTDLDTKVYITLLSTKEYTEDMPGYENYDSKEKELSSLGTEVYNEGIGRGYTDMESAKKLYKEIFNEEFPTELKDLIVKDNNIVSCPAYFYDSKNNQYIHMSACGGEDGITHLSYKYLYEKETTGDKEVYYAYVAVGYIKQEEMEVRDADGNLQSIEDELMLFHSYMTKDDAEYANSEDTKIDMNNYTKFDKFRYVFVKDNSTGNIYIDHVELLKETR